MKLTVEHKKINFQDVVVVDLHLPHGSTVHYERPPIDWFPLWMGLAGAAVLGFFGWMFYIFR